MIVNLHIQKSLKAASLLRKRLDSYRFNEASERTYTDFQLEKLDDDFLEHLVKIDGFEGEDDKAKVQLWLDKENESRTLSTLSDIEVVLSRKMQLDKNVLVTALMGSGIVGYQLRHCRQMNPFGTPVLRLSMSFEYGDQSESQSVFFDQNSVKTGNLYDIFKGWGFNLLNEEGKEAYFERVRATMEVQKGLKSKQVTIEGPVYVPPRFGVTPVKIMLPRGRHRAIVDDEVDLHSTMWYDDSDDEKSVGVFPWVRVFLLDRKAFVYVPVDRVKEYVYDRSAFNKVVLPEKTSTLLKQIFLSEESTRFGDLFEGRHGGTVVLADGPPGVGKTLTAEAIAELSGKPLYSADVAEIGVQADSVEESLKSIMDRASMWGAILLLDEADIFLTRRDMNIERNAIVGTFLKFLDHFQGTLFLTTNRVDTLDPAFASRITARIHYPKLSIEARKEIWTSLLRAAGLEVTGDIQELWERKYNGRQIRNFCRLAKMRFPGLKVTVDEFLSLEDHILQVEETW